MLNLYSICKALCSTNSTFYFSYPTWNLWILAVFQVPLSIYILRKSLTQIHPNLTILWRMCILCKFCQLYWQYIFAYYACIILIAFTFLVCSKWCWHNRLKPSTRVKLGWESDASLYSSHKSHPILLKVSVILVWVVNISLAWYTASIVKCGQQLLKNNQSSN